MVQGKPKRADPVIARWVEGRDALVQFRVLSGTPARTLANAHRLVAWAERHNEDIADIARCDHNFDLERPGLRRTPSRLEFAAAVLVLSLSVATLVLSITCTFAPRAWVSVKEPDAHTLFLSTTDARVWRSNRHFGVDECAAQPPASLAGEMGLSENEVMVVCGWLKDPKLPQNLDKTLEGQRLAFGLLALLGAGYAWFSRQWVASTAAARDMAKRLTARVGGLRRSRRSRRRKSTFPARNGEV